MLPCHCCNSASGNVLLFEVQAGLLESSSPFGRIRKDVTGAQSTGGYGILLVRSVPEPCTLTLLAAGLLAGAARFRKKTEISPLFQAEQPKAA